MRNAIFSIQTRMTKNQKERLMFLANAAGFKTLSGYIRHMIFNQNLDLKLNKILDSLKDLKKLVQE